MASDDDAWQCVPPSPTAAGTDKLSDAKESFDVRRYMSHQSKPYCQSLVRLVRWTGWR